MFRSQINFYEQLVIRLRDLRQYGIVYDGMTTQAMIQVLCGVDALNDFYDTARITENPTVDETFVNNGPFALFMAYGHQLETSMFLENMKMNLPNKAGSLSTESTTEDTERVA